MMRRPPKTYSLTDGFPIGVLPAQLREVVLSVHEDTQAPVSLIFASVLSAMSLGCQDLVDITRPDGKRHPINLYLLTLADSGERKSTVDSIIMASIHRYQVKLSASYNQEMADYQIASQLWETEYAATNGLWKTSLKNGGAEAAQLKTEVALLLQMRPVKPIRIEWLINDATPAAVKSRLVEQGTLGLFSDEGGSMLKSSLLSDTSFLNSLWSASDILVERKTTEPQRISDTRVTLALMVQPKLFDAFLEKHGEKTRGSGFLARCLFSKPKSTQGQRLANSIPYKAYCGSPLQEFFDNRLQTLLETTLARRRTNTARQVVQLSPEAKVLWFREYNNLEQRINQGQDLYPYRDVVSKLMEQMLRISAVITFFNHDSLEVNEQVLSAAIQLGRWYLYQFINLTNTSGAVTKEEEDANAIYTWLEQRLDFFRMPGVRKNHVRQYGPNCARSKVRLDQAVETLARQGRLVVIHGRTTYLRNYTNDPHNIAGNGASL